MLCEEAVRRKRKLVLMNGTDSVANRRRMSESNKSTVTSTSKCAGLTQRIENIAGDGGKSSRD